MRRWRLGALALAIAGLSVAFASPAGASGGTFFPYSQPGTPASPSYTGITCVIDFSSIPDFTTGITSVSGCGVTVTFSVPMEKRSVNASWCCGPWGSPGDVESANPAILWTENGVGSVTLTYHTTKPAGAGRRTVGVEVSPDWFDYDTTFTATFTGAGGGTDGTVVRDTTSTSDSGNAVLIAARTKTVPKVTSLTITGSGNPVGNDFAIAQIRV